MKKIHPGTTAVLLLSLACLVISGCAKGRIAADASVVTSTLVGLDKSMAELEGMVSAIKPKVDGSSFSAISSALTNVRAAVSDLKQDPFDRTRASGLFLSLDNLYQKLLEAQTDKNEEALFAVEDVVDQIQSEVLEPVYKVKSKKKKR